MAKPFIDEAQEKRIIEEYNVEAAYRKEAYWDTIETANPFVQAFRFIMKNYDISFEKQERLGKQGDGYRICVNKKKRARNDL
jgi:hypothetical protein